MYILKSFLLFIVTVLAIACSGKAPNTSNAINSLKKDKVNKEVSKETNLLSNEEKTKRMAESKKLGKGFAKALQKELKSALKSGDVAHAVSVCKDVSNSYENKFSKKNPDIISFRRISMKARNVDSHTPTLDEANWLTKMAKDISTGAKPLPGTLEGKDSLTVLMPIVIKKKLCLKCHGDSAKFSEELKSALNKDYPLDSATGFNMGDLRGALSVEWKRK